jgi:muramoyltetrapeptide carboxypeptidase
MTPNRIHIIASANPLLPDAAKLGVSSVDDYVAFVRQSLPPPFRLTFDRKVLRAKEQERHGGRMDDAARVRDLQGALNDPATLAIVATNGGAYLSRILPHIDFSPLARRRTPLWAFGFSELTGLVNLVASYRGGRGVYWLCPNFLGWHVRPLDAAREAFAEFWRILPQLCTGRGAPDTLHFTFGPLRGELCSGRLTSGRVRLVGGCLSVLSALVGGPIGRRIRPDGKWLIIEDIKETPYRVDRHLAALKLAGWFERVGGVLVGDFRMMHTDTQPAVLELLPYHLPRGRNIPVVATHSFGHLWPNLPVLLNRPVQLTVRRRSVGIEASPVGGVTR